MKMVMIAALVAAPVPAAASPVQAAEPPREESAAQQTFMESKDIEPVDRSTQARIGERVELALADAQAPGAGGAPESPQAAQQDEPKKRKSTGDKVLTGAAVILGIGAVAVGALLVAIFVN